MVMEMQRRDQGTLQAVICWSCACGVLLLVADAAYCYASGVYDLMV